MPDTSMTALGGEQPEALAYISQVVARHCHRPSHHDRTLAFQQKDQTQPRGLGFGVRGSSAYAAVASPTHNTDSTSVFTSGSSALERVQAAMRPRLCPRSPGAQAVRVRPDWDRDWAPAASSDDDDGDNDDNKDGDEQDKDKGKEGVGI
jgi:hypothetical protein